MSKVKIYGNPNPVIGIKEYYSIHDFFSSSAPSKFIEPLQKTPDENIKWSVWILLGKEWVKMTKNNKTGATVDYTFTQVSLKRKGIRMLVDANGEKAVLDIKTKENAESKILQVEILDSNGKKPTKLFSYGETITARVHCLNMEKFRINVTLWENDGGKKDLSDISIETKEANVLNGIADVKFTFDPSKVWLANAKTAPNESNEGAFHEYYVTAEFYKKVSKPTQDINVINPDYKIDILSKTSASKPSETETQKTSPAEQKGPSKKETRGIVKADGKAHDYQEQKIDVQPTVVYNPQQEFINSLLMVNVGDSKLWGNNKSKSNNKCPRCDEDFNYNDIAKIFPSASKNKTLAEKLISEINILRAEYEVNTCLRKAHLINQFGSETGFNTLIEGIDGYSTKTLTSLFGYFKRHPKEAETYQGNLYEIAVRAYGLRKVDKEEDIVSCSLSPGGNCNDLGNENKEEGYKYIGRGLIQLTGKYNYTQINKDFIKAFPNKGDLVKSPELLEEPKYAAMSAFSYWINNDLNSKADLGFNRSNVDSITKIINKNLDASHYEKRRKSFIKAKDVYRLGECKNIGNSENEEVFIRLIRRWQTNKSTIGEFTIDNSDIVGFMLEEKGPDTVISGKEQRIPIGTYNLVWHNGSKFENVLKLYNKDVSIDRAILIHSGNSAEDTKGCLLPGSSRSTDWVSKSKDKLDEINNYINSIGIENAKIIITEEYE
ncbi:DUF5675 family protein [Flavobacterium sharifuzzamanii]|uniref:DUF5675 family protein n=1 Tax=Flavobacterium sharifuzzamanii TaxID=2211133 RepID=UPI000DAC5EAE|nr:DUF5675 family protein [Flavobacterium sharifuzzamanii]KAF2081879.1 hypothetical protein DMA14_05270 [Flavobacterium sharifuzzamanii]